MILKLTVKVKFAFLAALRAASLSVLTRLSASRSDLAALHAALSEGSRLQGFYAMALPSRTQQETAVRSFFRSSCNLKKGLPYALHPG